MKIGLKYCGGCNPNYERSHIVKRARAEYPQAVFAPYDPEDAYDLVLMICGCLEECTSFNCSNSRCGIVRIRSEEEYIRLQQAMKKMVL